VNAVARHRAGWEWQAVARWTATPVAFAVEAARVLTIAVGYTTALAAACTIAAYVEGC
jgi:hypothetical protein